VVLRRYKLNNTIFHEPLGELTGGSILSIKTFAGYDEGEPHFKYVLFTGRVVNTIHGLIKHEPMDANPKWAFYYLMWHYNKPNFFKTLAADVDMYHPSKKRKLKNLLLKNNPLKVLADFFDVKKEQLAEIDDLPF
jgi:hypothetical protein